MKIRVRRHVPSVESTACLNTVLVLLKANRTPSSIKHLKSKIDRLQDSKFIATLRSELENGYSVKFRQRIEPVVTLLRKYKWDIDTLVQHLRKKWGQV